MIKCTCGKEYSEEFAFCPYCGKEKPQPKTENVCEKCGKSFPLEFAFCPICGKPFAEEKPKKPAAPKTKYCKNCSAVILDGMAFCGVCGTPVAEKAKKPSAPKKPTAVPEAPIAEGPSRFGPPADDGFEETPPKPTRGRKKVDPDLEPPVDGGFEETPQKPTRGKKKYDPDFDPDNTLLVVESGSLFVGDLKNAKDFFNSTIGRFTFYGDRVVFEQTGSRKGELVGNTFGLIGSSIGKKIYSHTRSELYYDGMSSIATTPYPGNKKYQMITLTCAGTRYTLFCSSSKSGYMNLGKAQNEMINQMLDVLQKHVSE